MVEIAFLLVYSFSSYLWRLIRAATHCLLVCAVPFSHALLTSSAILAR